MAEILGIEIQNNKVSHLKMPDFDQLSMDRFWTKVAITADTKCCWEWQANKPRGYGTFSFNREDGSKRTLRSNRVAYYLNYGVDPLDNIVKHSCDNPSCCNPNHLSLGTQFENIQDRVLKGRSSSGFGLRNGTHTHPEKVRKGSLNGSSKLTESQVVEILSLGKQGYSNIDIAHKYGIGATNISYIVSGRSWKHIKRD